MKTRDMAKLMRNRTMPHVDDERIAARLLALEAVAVAAEREVTAYFDGTTDVTAMPMAMGRIKDTLAALLATGWTGGRGRTP